METGANQLRCRPRILAVLATCAGLVLAACGPDDVRREIERQGISVGVASLSLGGLVLTVEVPTCNANPAAAVSQGASEIRIAVEVDRQLGDDLGDCLDEVRVDLSEPLAGRRVIDVSSGREIEVDRP